MHPDTTITKPRDMTGIIGIPKIVFTNPTLDQKAISTDGNGPVLNQRIFDALIDEVTRIRFSVLYYAEIIQMGLYQPTDRLSTNFDVQACRVAVWHKLTNEIDTCCIIWRQSSVTVFADVSDGGLQID